MGFVIDASVAFALIVDEPQSAKARRLVRRAGSLIAPDLLALELANALWKFAGRPDPEKEAMRRARALPLHADRAKAAKEAFALLIGSRKIDFVDSEALAVKALDLALELDHPVYDCTYLALALAEPDSQLVTSDGKFRRKLPEKYSPLVIDLAEADAL